MATFLDQEAPRRQSLGSICIDGPTSKMGGISSGEDPERIGSCVEPANGRSRRDAVATPGQPDDGSCPIADADQRDEHNLVYGFFRNSDNMVVASRGIGAIAEAEK